MGKILTHHEIIGHIAEQIESVITYPPPAPPSAIMTHCGRKSISDSLLICLLLNFDTVAERYFLIFWR